MYLLCLSYVVFYEGLLLIIFGTTPDCSKAVESNFTISSHFCWYAVDWIVISRIYYLCQNLCRNPGFHLYQILILFNLCRIYKSPFWFIEGLVDYGKLRSMTEVIFREVRRCITLYAEGIEVRSSANLRWAWIQLGAHITALSLLLIWKIYANFFFAAKHAKLYHFSVHDYYLPSNHWICSQSIDRDF